MLFKNILIVGFGGMIGTVLRYLSGLLIGQFSFPFATLIVNILGSLFIGAIMGFGFRDESLPNWQLFLATGLCGGFTTYSAFAWENLQLLNQQRYGIFIIYTLTTLFLGLLAVTLGYWLTKQM